MNSFDDPADRLVDSLLREEVRGIADEPLLQDIAARIDAGRTSSNLVPVQKRWGVPLVSAVAAIVVIAALLIGLSVRDSRQRLEPPNDGELTVEKAPRPVVDAELAGSDEGEIVAENSIRPRGALSMTSEHDGKWTSDRDGLLCRGLTFLESAKGTSVYAHDPVGGGVMKLELESGLNSSRRIFSARGNTVVFTSSSEVSSAQDEGQILGRAEVPEGCRSCTFVFLPGGTELDQDLYRVLVIDDSPKRFPMEAVLIYNLYPDAIRLNIEKDVFQIPAGQKKLIRNLPFGPDGVASVDAYQFSSGEWRRVFSTKWPQLDRQRLAYFFFESDGRINVNGIGFPGALDTNDTIKEDTKLAEAEGPGTGGPDPDQALDSLRFVREEAVVWYVLFGFESGGRWAPTLLGKTPDGSALMNRVAAGNMISPGEVFFKDMDFSGRFKFIGFVEREVLSEQTGLTQLRKAAIYEDLKSNKKGDRYESQSFLPKSQIETSAYRDRTAVLKLMLSGQEGVEFKLEERTWFSIPLGSGEKRFFLKQVAEDSAVIEYAGPDGDTRSRVIKN